MDDQKELPKFKVTEQGEGAPESTHSRPNHGGRLGLAHSLLNFPSPHKLGQSIGSNIRKSSSLRALRPNDPGTSESAAEVLKRLSQEIGIDETDFQRPSAKRPRLEQPFKTIVTTHDGTPLKEFSLYLPAKLPAAIPESIPALQELVYKTTSTYLRLWSLDPEMDYVDIRLSSPYEDKLSDSADFLEKFITVAFRELVDVQSIQDLYIPKVELQAATHLHDILTGIAAGPNISNLYLSLESSLNKKKVLAYDFKSLVSFLHAIKLEQVIVVSPDHVMSEFCKKLEEEAKRLKKCDLQVVYRNADLSVPGPDYLTSLTKESASGELIEPSVLVTSMNIYRDKRKRKEQPFPVVTKSKSTKVGPKSAFSSDCTYFDEAELTTNGPFPSTIWNLERLHNDGIDGSNINIAIIDSGISYTHPTFKNKIVAVKNFVDSKIDNIDCVIDSDGHGTHCAGLAAGCEFFCPTTTDPNSECILIPPGVAPGAKLVICKVVKTSDGEVDSDAFITALHWLKDVHVSGKIKIDVISVSLAATYYSHKQAQIVSEMTSLGVIFVCCASNVGRLHLQPIAFPARLGQVLCIGAHDENGKPTSFSPVGRELDFLSPGDNLWGPGPGTEGPFAMDCASGTSCATPAVAGLICLILQAVSNICHKNPKKYQIGGRTLIELVHNVWVMRELLKVISSSPGHHSDEIGYGTLNPYRLLDRSDDEILRIVNDIVEDE